MYFGYESAVIRTNVFNNIPFEVWQSEYTGFITFTKKKCGIDLLDALVDGRITWSIIDGGAYYTTQFGYKRVDGRHTSTTLQFYRHDHSEENDMGTVKKDQFYLVIQGIDKVQWDTYSMEECFTGYHVGAMEVTTADGNHAKCAGWDKDTGW